MKEVCQVVQDPATEELSFSARNPALLGVSVNSVPTLLSLMTTLLDPLLNTIVGYPGRKIRAEGRVSTDEAVGWMYQTRASRGLMIPEAPTDPPKS